MTAPPARLTGGTTPDAHPEDADVISAELLATTTALIPVVSFAALAVSLVYFVRTKGNIDALKEAVETYKTLAEAHEARAVQLDEALKECRSESSGLRERIAAQERAAALAIDEIIAGIRRAATEGGAT